MFIRHGETKIILIIHYGIIPSPLVKLVLNSLIVDRLSLSYLISKKEQQSFKGQGFL